MLQMLSRANEDHLIIRFSLSNKSLWNILEEPIIINASEFEDLFAKSITKTKRKPLSEAYEKKSKARKVRNLISVGFFFFIHSIL